MIINLNPFKMTLPENGHVTLETGNSGVATISFYHPAQNSVPSVLLSELAARIDEAGKDEQVHVIIMKSEGDRTFCAGASFDELLQIKDKATGAAFFSGFANVINAMRTSPKIVIARVQGKAVGGGVGLAAAADYCFATTAAAIKLSELAIGIGPFVIEPAVTRKIGLAAFTHLTLNAGDFQNADWAKEKGLYNDVYADVAAMDIAISNFSNKLASYNPEALRYLKKTLWAGTQDWDDLLTQRAIISGELVLSDFTQQALQGFLNGKR